MGCGGGVRSRDDLCPGRLSFGGRRVPVVFAGTRSALRGWRCWLRGWFVSVGEKGGASSVARHVRGRVRGLANSRDVFRFQRALACRRASIDGRETSAWWQWKSLRRFGRAHHPEDGKALLARERLRHFLFKRAHRRLGFGQWSSED